jgi:hypothetical protein
VRARERARIRPSRLVSSIAAPIEIDILHVVVVDDPNLAILPSELGGIVADLLDHSRHAIAENDAARDLGPRGITVNAIQPGPTETDMNSNEAIRARVRPQMTLGRLGRDSEVASLIAYLASPESDFITGAALTVDGGYLA